MPDNPEPTWLPIQPPIEFHLTTTGSLTIEFGATIGTSISRFGIEIPAERVQVLRRGLEETKTTQEMLSVRPPQQRAH